MELIKKDQNKKTIYIDMDGVVANFKKGVIDGQKEYPNVKYQQSRYGFFLDLEPIVGSIETIKWLKEHFNVYFLTRPSIYNLNCYSEKAYWIKKHFGFEWLNYLIISCDKTLLIGDYLIDDSIAHGQENFNGVLLRFGHDVFFSDWTQIRKYFEELI